MQWLDNKPVTFLSTVHKKANPYVYFQRHVKVNRQYRPVHVRQPKLVKDYNTNMSGVNKSDQLINKYNTLRKTHRWWKTLFFHFVDAVRVNSFVLFNVLRAKYLDIAKLQRPKTYNQLDFTVELIKEIVGVQKDQDVPLFQAKSPPPVQSTTSHPIIPTHGKSRNRILCWARTGEEKKTIVKCGTCGKHLCFQSSRNCLLEYHTMVK